MNNKKSSYYKLFRFALLIVVIVLILIGTLLTSICSAIYKKSKLKELQSAGEMFTSCISDEYHKSGDGYIEQASHFQQI